MKRRQRKTRAEWQSLIKQQEQSDSNISEFCQQHNVSETSFQKWRLCFTREDRGFSKIPIKSSCVPGKIRCIMPNGLRLEWDESVSSNTLLPVLKALS